MSDRSDKLHDYGLSVVLVVLAAVIGRVLFWSARELWARWM